MKRLWLTTTLVVCSLMQTATHWNSAQAGDPIAEKLLPKDTLIYFSVPSVPEARKEFDKSSFGGLLGDPEMKPILGELKEKFDEWSDNVQEEIGVSVADLVAIPQGEIAFAVVEKPSRKLSLVFLLDYGDNQETVDKLLKKMHESLDGDLAEHSTEDVDSAKIHVYTFKNADKNFNTLCYVTEKSHLVFSSNLDALKDIVERWGGDDEESFSSNTTHKYIQDRCKDEAGEPSMVWFMNPIGLVQVGANMLQSITPQAGMAGLILPMLGLDKFKGYGGAAYGESGEFDSVSKSFMYVESPSGLLNAFQFPATELKPPKWIPAEIGTYMCANWDCAKAYTAIEGLVDSFQGRGSLARLMDQAADNGPGIHVKKDFLDALEGKIHFVQGTSDDEEETQGQFLMALEVKDAAKMKKTLAKIAKSDGSRIEAREFNGETIYEIDANQPMSFAVAAGQFVFTNDTPMLEGMLRTESQPPLADSPAFRKIARFFPAKTSIISFQRPDTQLKALYQLLKDSDTDVIDTSKLPSFEVFQKYLQPTGTYTVPDKKGAFSVGFQVRDK